MHVVDMNVLEGSAPAEEESRHGAAPPRERNRAARRAEDAVRRRGKGGPAAADAALGQDGLFWHALINEDMAADFVGVTARTMQKHRQAGTGPPFIQLSLRCIRYRRLDLKAWIDAHVRRSTSDRGEEEVA
jgi:hypothetical protein